MKSSTVSRSFGRSLSRVALVCLALATTAPLAACSGANSPTGERGEQADKWFKRALKDYGEARVEEANESIKKALSLAPGDPEVKLLGGRIALSRLEYDETVRLLKGVEGSEAKGLRGRALWYQGDLTGAADELEGMLNDPDVHDDWAKAISTLARRGEGRTPFTVSGGLLTAVDMAQVSPMAPYLVIPVEIDGEQALAMVSTGVAEVIVDSSSRAEPSWISLRLGERLEVSDVPALTQDLSGLSKEIGAPIKALLGVNLLRHLNVTVDYLGRQFVARTFAAPPPPNATRINLYYARGGGMLVSAPLGATDAARAALFIDSSSRFPIQLDENGWSKAGITSADLKPIPGDPEQKYKEGIVPILKLGAFTLPRVPGVFGGPIGDIEKGLKFDIDGILGCQILANYRITLSDGGRVMWLEDNAFIEDILQSMQQAPPVGPDGPPLDGVPGGPLNQGEGLGGGMGQGLQLGNPNGAPPPSGGNKPPKSDAPKAPPKK